MGVRKVAMDPALGFSARQAAADFPGLFQWFRCQEGAGATLLEDSARPGGSSVVTTLPTIGGANAADAWNTPGGVRSGSGGANPDIILRGMVNISSAGYCTTAAALKSMIFLLDYTPLVSTGVIQSLLVYGNNTNTSGTLRGAGIYINSSNNLSFRACGASAAGSYQELAGHSFAAGVRSRLCVVWDRSGGDAGALSVYANGERLVDAVAYVSTPGSVTLDVSGGAARATIMTNSGAGSRFGEAVVHEAQMWGITSLPDPDLFGYYMSANRRLPSVLDGVT